MLPDHALHTLTTATTGEEVLAALDGLLTAMGDLRGALADLNLTPTPTRRDDT